MEANTLIIGYLIASSLYFALKRVQFLKRNGFIFMELNDIVNLKKKNQIEQDRGIITNLIISNHFLFFFPLYFFFPT